MEFDGELDLGNIALVYDRVLDKLAKIAESFQGDSTNDVVARTIIGNARQLMDAMYDNAGKEINGLMTAILTDYMKQLAITVNLLEKVAELKGGKSE